MEYHHKLLLVTAAFVAVALYIAFTSSGPAELDRGEAENLLIRSAGFGRELTDYTYAYSDYSDGFRVAYTLTSSNGSRLMVVENPLSVKKVYLLGNDTIFCIRYAGNESCASVKGDKQMANYVAFAQSKFFNETTIVRSRETMEALIERGYLSAEPEVTDAASGTSACRKVTYVIDYSNATIEDAALFGISSQSPKRYELTRCIDPESWLAYETTLEYQDNGISHSRTTKVSHFSSGPQEGIRAPELSGNPVTEFNSEREKQVKLATCFTDMQGSGKEACIAEVALSIRRTDICALAGSRKDRCLVSIVPLTKDAAICTMITDASFKQDCYTELAGAFKDASYCDYVSDPEKKAFCQEIAVPSAPGQPPAEDVGEEAAPDGPAPPPAGDGNESSAGGAIDIGDFIEYVDRTPMGSANGTGNGTNASEPS